MALLLSSGEGDQAKLLLPVLGEMPLKDIPDDMVMSAFECSLGMIAVKLPLADDQVERLCKGGWVGLQNEVKRVQQQCPGRLATAGDIGKAMGLSKSWAEQVLNGTYPPVKQKRPLTTSEAQEYSKKLKAASSAPAGQDARESTRGDRYPWPKVQMVGVSLTVWLKQVLEKKLSQGCRWLTEDAQQIVNYINQHAPSHNPGLDVGELDQRRLKTWMDKNGWPKSRFMAAATAFEAAAAMEPPAVVPAMAEAAQAAAAQPAAAAQVEEVEVMPAAGAPAANAPVEGAPGANAPAADAPAEGALA